MPYDIHYYCGLPDRRFSRAQVGEALALAILELTLEDLYLSLDKSAA